MLALDVLVLRSLQCETLATVFARVRLHAQVYEQVAFEIGLREEGLVTVRTLVPPIVGMRHHVSVKRILRGVRLAAAWIGTVVHRLEMVLLMGPNLGPRGVLQLIVTALVSTFHHASLVVEGDVI